jgi:hypothetical protein
MVWRLKVRMGDQQQAVKLHLDTRGASKEECLRVMLNSFDLVKRQLVDDPVQDDPGPGFDCRLVVSWLRSVK